MAETETKTQKYRSKMRELHDDAVEWRSQWKDISEFIVPEKGRYLANVDEKQNRGNRKNQRIINGTGKKAIRTLAAGMQGGLTSPARPWFVLTLPDKELTELASAKFWLESVRTRMEHILQRSNFYNSIHGQYGEPGAFGTAAMLIESDTDTVVRFTPFTIGEYYIALGPDLRPNMLYRHFSMTARQLKKKFGMSVMSDAAKQAIESGKSEYRYEVIHAIQPNGEMGPTKKDARGKAYESVYFEVRGDPDVFLQKGGYESIPFVAPRWDVTGVDSYGYSPGMDALGDSKMLQKIEAKKLKALDKEIDPPMNAPSSMKNRGGTVIPGGINYQDPTQGSLVFSPAQIVKLNIRDVSEEIGRVERRIESEFYNELFLATLGTDKTMTATEVTERQTEKLTMLGPVLERLQAEMLDPIVERVFSIMQEFNLIPDVPEEMDGAELKIEYVSTLAQAQKAVGTQSVERVAGFVANLAQTIPNVLDKINADETVDIYAKMMGTPPQMIRSDDAVAVIRERAAKQQAQLQQQEQAAQLAQGAKTLSETKLNTDSALDAVSEGIQ